MLQADILAKEGRLKTSEQNAEVFEVALQDQNKMLCISDVVALRMSTYRRQNQAQNCRTNNVLFLLETMTITLIERNPTVMRAKIVVVWGAVLGWPCVNTHKHLTLDKKTTGEHVTLIGESLWHNGYSAGLQFRSKRIRTPVVLLRSLSG